MRESIGSVFLYNIIIVFIVITFGFLSASLSYMKAFKVNGKIANSLEKYEGYNMLSDQEIAQTLNTIGYRIDKVDCPEKRGYVSVDKLSGEKDSYMRTLAQNKQHEYCLYEYIDGSDFEGGYFSYGIVTYIHLDIPIIGGIFKIPVYSETESIFRFSD